MRRWRRPALPRRTPASSPTSSPAPGSTTARWPTPARSRSRSGCRSASPTSIASTTSATSSSRSPAASMPAAITTSATSASSASTARARNSTRSRSAARRTRRPRSATSSAPAFRRRTSSTRSRSSSRPICACAPRRRKASSPPIAGSAQTRSRRRSMPTLADAASLASASPRRRDDHPSRGAGALPRRDCGGILVRRGVGGAAPSRRGHRSGDSGAVRRHRPPLRRDAGLSRRAGASGSASPTCAASAPRPRRWRAGSGRNARGVGSRWLLRLPQGGAARPGAGAVRRLDLRPQALPGRHPGRADGVRGETTRASRSIRWWRGPRRISPITPARTICRRIPWWRAAIPRSAVRRVQSRRRLTIPVVAAGPVSTRPNAASTGRLPWP